MFIHSILETNSLITVDGDETIDLPVNPLSVVLIHISPLNETTTITNYHLLEALLGALTQVRVLFKGSPVVSGSGTDMGVLAMLWHRLVIWQSNAVETDNDRRSIVLPILLGRRPYDAKECFPESRRGELQLSMTWDIAAAGFDGLRRSVETIELPDAKPEFTQKVTTLAQTFAATGQNDVELPVGNVLRALLCFGTTPFSGAAPAPSLGQMEVLVDNVNVGYSSTDFEVSRSLIGLAGVRFPPDFRHIHSVNAAGAAREDTLEPEIGASIDDNYTLLPFDVTWDDVHSLPTAGAGRVNLRVAAEAADAVRILPVERVEVSTLQRVPR